MITPPLNLVIGAIPHASIVLMHAGKLILYPLWIKSNKSLDSIRSSSTATCNSVDCAVYCTLRARIKGAASAIFVIQHSLRGGARNTAWHVIVLAFLTQENKASKMQSTINQLKHGKGRAVCDNGTHGVVSIDHTARGVAECCMAILTTRLVPLLRVPHFLPCFN